MNLPNKISMLRILLIPIMVIVFLLWDIMPNFAGLIGAGIFALASLTDFLDGYIARKYNMITNLGKYLDSIADKLLVSSALILVPIYILPIATFGIVGILTVAIVVIIIAREFIISALRQAAAASNFIMAADNFGRVKAAVQYVALIILLPAHDLDVLLGLTNHVFVYIGFAVLCVATVLTILSAIHYLVKNKSVFTEESLVKNGGIKK